MIRVTEILLNPSTKKATVSLFADTKSDVDNLTDVSEIDGFPEGYEIEMGSDVMTASAELGFMKSDGTWEW